MTSEQQNPLAVDKISSLILRFSVPSIIAMLVSAVYNIADQLFIGNAVGTLGNAATNIAFPLAMMCTGLGLLFGIGGAASFNLHMGAGKKEKAPYFVGNAITMLLTVGILLFAITELFLNPLLVGFGSPADVLPLARQYVRVTAIGFPFLILTIGSGHLIRADGSPKMAMFVNISGAVINIVLDIVFVSQFHMGVAGVAYATVIAQAISAVLCMWRLMRMTDIFDFRPKYLKMKKQYSMEIIRLGLPSGITQAIFSMAMVIVQSLTNSFGEMVIAANVIIMRVDGFAMMPNFSFGTAMTTYAGQNVGARRMDRVEQGAKQGTLVAVGTSTTITLLIVIFGHHLMGIFTNTTELVTLSANMMKILAVGYIAMAITQSLSGVMRGAGDTMTPMWISMVVTVVIRVPLAYGLAFLTRTPELPNGRYQVLWISMLVSWCMGALLTLIFYKKGNWKKKALTGSSSEK
mgnify:CR=1 FL=1|jgi:putative MATE family efflux protein